MNGKPVTSRQYAIDLPAPDELVDEPRVLHPLPSRAEGKLVGGALDERTGQIRVPQAPACRAIPVVLLVAPVLRDRLATRERTQHRQPLPRQPVDAQLQ